MRLKLNHNTRGFTLIEIIITLTVTAVLATMIYTYFGKAFSESVTPITRLKNSASLQRVMENIRADYNIYPKWRSGAAYTTSNYIIPPNFNGHYYKCTTAGTSGATEPNWPTNCDGTVADNGIIWTESNSPWISYPKWRGGAAYTTCSYVIPMNSNGHYYRCTTAGTSGTTEPTWPLSSGGIVSDNGVIWRESGTTVLTTLSGKIGAQDSDQTANDYGKNPDGTTYTKYNVVRNRFTQFVNDIDQDSDASGVNKILKVTLKNDNGETLTALFFSY